MELSKRTLFFKLFKFENVDVLEKEGGFFSQTFKV